MRRALLLVCLCSVLTVSAVAGAWAFLAPSSPSEPPSLTQCASTNQDDIESCLRRELPILVADRGPAVAMSALKDLMQRVPAAAAACHSSSHAAGRAAFEASKDLDYSLAYLEGTCQGGYQHGVFDAWALSLPEDPDAWMAEFAHAARICDTAEDGLPRYLCSEGAGHAAWVTAGGDLDRAVRACGLSTSISGRDGCMGGLVMQRYAPIVVDEPLPREPIDELGDTCRAVSEDAWSALAPVSGTTPRTACRRGAVYPIGMDVAAMDREESTPTDFRERFEGLCNGLADPRDRDSGKDVDGCLTAWGFAAWALARGNAEKARLLCTQAGGPLEDACVAKVDAQAELANTT